MAGESYYQDRQAKRVTNTFFFLKGNLLNVNLCLPFLDHYMKGQNGQVQKRFLQYSYDPPNCLNDSLLCLSGRESKLGML